MIGMVRVFCPFTTTGAGRFVLHMDGARFVLACKVKPVKFVGQVKTTFEPPPAIANSGGAGGTGILNAVPLSKAPPPVVVPYSELSEIVNPATGLAPRAPSNEYKLVKPVPSARMANTVPFPELPPANVVP